MEREKATHSMATMCRVLGVSPSGYYAWRTRSRSVRAQANARLTYLIREIQERSPRTYGAPRIHAELRAEGTCCGRKRVARLMRQAGLVGAPRRRMGRTTVRDQAAAPAPDLVCRAFMANRPNQLWVADITYVRTWGGWLYLAAVLDAFSREVVGWAMEITCLSAEPRKDESNLPNLPLRSFFAYSLV